MTRSLLAAAGLLLLLLGGGLAAQRWLFLSSPTAVEATSSAPIVAQVSSAPLAVELFAVVADSAPDSEVFVPREGAWRKVVPGERLSADSVLRTRDGKISLRIGDQIRATVSPKSQFRLGELSSQLSKVKLEGGHVLAQVDGKHPTELLVQVLDSDAEVRAKDGDFAMLRSEQGQVTIAATRGNVAVSAAGQSLTVGEGELSIVAPGGVPSAPIQIPGEVLLKLSQGYAKNLSQRSTWVKGEATPGAIVTVNGLPAENKDGHFELRVPLREGMNDVKVIARDVMFRETLTRVTGIQVDTEPPEMEGRVKW